MKNPYSRFRRELQIAMGQAQAVLQDAIALEVQFAALSAPAASPEPKRRKSPPPERLARKMRPGLPGRRLPLLNLIPVSPARALSRYNPISSGRIEP